MAVTGKTSQPLTILVHPDLIEYSEFKALAAMGHNVQRLDGSYASEDLIIGPNCHYLDRHLIKYVDEAVKWARKRKKALVKKGGNL